MGLERGQLLDQAVQVGAFCDRDRPGLLQKQDMQRRAHAKIAVSYKYPLGSHASFSL